MLRKIIAVIVGSLIIYASERLVLISGLIPAVIDPPIPLPLWKSIITQHVPFLIGCMITGYIAQHRGWLLGLLSAVIYIVYDTVYWYRLLGPLYFSEYHFTVTIGLLYIRWILVGIIAGYLGQFLAQIWHKRHLQKR